MRVRRQQRTRATANTTATAGLQSPGGRGSSAGRRRVGGQRLSPECEGGKPEECIISGSILRWACRQNGGKVQGQNLSIVPEPSSCTSSSSSAPRDALGRRRRRVLNSSPCQVPDAFAQKRKRNHALQAYGHTLPSAPLRCLRHCCSELEILLCRTCAEIVRYFLRIIATKSSNHKQ